MTIQQYNDIFKNPVTKSMSITSSGGITITNTNICLEEMSLEESLCSDGNLTIGACESACFKIRIADMNHNFEGELLTVNQVIPIDQNTDETIPYGVFKVISDKATNDRKWRDLTCYDAMYDILNADVSEWFNSLTFPMTVKNLRDSFFTYLGVTQVTTTLVNDNFQTQGGFSVSGVLSGKDIITAICEINGVFGHISRQGQFEYISLPSADSLTLDWYMDGTGAYEDYLVQKITGIVARSSESDVGTSVGTDTNLYVVEDNPLIYGSEGTASLTTALTNLLNNVKDINYRPFNVDTYGNPMLPLGTNLTITTRNQTINSFLMTRVLSGIQSLKDSISAKGEKYRPTEVNSLRSEVNRTKGKIHELVVTTDELRSTISSIEEIAEEASEDASDAKQTAEGVATDLSNNYFTKSETTSEISQSATSILSTVSQTYTPKASAIKTDTLHYLATSQSSGVTTSTPGWTTTIQSVTSTDKYLWTYHTYTYADDHTSDTTPIITGVYGDQGQQGQQGPQGTTGTGVSSVTPLYYAGSSTPSKPTSAVTSTSTSGGQWTKAIPSLSTTYPNLYTCDQVYYTNGTYSWSDVVSDINSTTSYSEINQLKDKIVLKVDNSGKIVKAALSADPSTGSTFQIDADYIFFKANKTIDLVTGNIAISANNFSIDNAGNVTLTGTIHANAGDIAGWTISTNKLYKTYTLSDSNEEYEVALISQFANAQIYSQQTVTNRNYSQRASLKNGRVVIECSIGSTHDTYNSLVSIGASRTGTAQETTQANGSVSIRHTDDTKPYMWLENNHLSIMSKTDDVYYPNAVVSTSGIYYQKPDYDTTVMMNADGLFLPYLGNSARNKILLVSTASTSNKVGVSPVSADELECLLGATSNIQGQIDDVNEDIDGLGAEIDGLGAKSVSGNPVVITDAEAMNADEVIVTITPKQDLHGYANSWVGGEGKNKYSILFGNDAFNANGSASYSNDNGTLVINATSNNGSGVYTKTSSTIRALPADFSSGSITYSFDIKASNANTLVRVGYENFGRKDVTVGTSWQRVTTTVTADGNGHNFVVYNYSGSAVEIRVKNVMFEVGSVAHDYEPYENICPISGLTQSTVDRCGKNICPVSEVVNPTTSSSFFDLKAGTYTFSFRLRGSGRYSTSSILLRDTQQSQICRVIVGYSSSGTFSGQFTLTEDKTVQIFVSNITASSEYYIDNCQIEVGSQATDYAVYLGKQITFQFGQTIYGGTINYSTGVGTLTWGKQTYTTLNRNLDTFYWYYINNAKPNDVTLKCDKSPTSPNRSNVGVYTDQYAHFCIRTNNAYANSAALFSAFGGSFDIVYELATPLTIQLSPKQIELLLNNNTLTTNCDSLDITYQTNSGVGDTASALDKRVASLEDKTVYSTTEKLIGTWIDGKLLYQKTITLQSANVRDVGVDISSLNVDYLGFVRVDAINADYICHTYSSGNTEYVFPYYVKSNHYLYVAVAGPFKPVGSTFYVTIQYTKIS